MHSARSVLAFLQNQRHRFINHLQVLAGWLQLGDAAQVERYLGKVVDGLQEEGRLGHLEPPELALALTQAHWVAVDLDLRVTWRIQKPSCGPASGVLCAEVGHLVEQAAAMVSEAGGRELLVRIGADGKVWELGLSGEGLAGREDRFQLTPALSETGLRVKLGTIPDRGKPEAAG